jgi:hypothetical protein
MLFSYLPIRAIGVIRGHSSPAPSQSSLTGE